MKTINTIFWDFDGVIMNSNAVRDRGFEEVLKDFPKEQVNQLMSFHQDNGGLSRYVKFRYFFEDIRQESISDDEVNLWAKKFSKIMLELLINKNLLIDETLQFIKDNHQNYNMHIVSGSDQNELRQICKAIGIAKYFDSIHGSPKPKTKWVGELINKYNYDQKSTCLIGDSKNDYEAARDNKIYFVGYGNERIVELSDIMWADVKVKV